MFSTFEKISQVFSKTQEANIKISGNYQQFFSGLLFF